MNEPWHPGPVAIIADCPDESYLPSLLGAGVWQQRCFQPASAASQGEEAASQKAVDVVCHLARAEVCPPSPTLQGCSSAGTPVYFGLQGLE